MPRDTLPVPTTPTLAEREHPADRLAREFIAAQRSPNTRAAYARALADWAGWLADRGLDPLAVDRSAAIAYVRDLERQGFKPATVRMRAGAVRSFYIYAVDLDVIERNPFARVTLPRVADESPNRGIEDDDWAALLDAAASSGPRDHALVLLLGGCGLRVSEACAARIEDLGNGGARRTLTITGKGGERQTVPLDPRVVVALDRVIGDRCEGYLLATRSGRPLDRHNAAATIRRLARDAGIAGRVSPHSLRHGFVTRALDRGVGLHHVQDAARHRSPETTQRYNRHRHRLDNPAFAAAL